MLDQLDSARQLDQEMNLNQTIWSDYSRQTLEAHGNKVRRSNSNGVVKQSEDIA